MAASGTSLVGETTIPLTSHTRSEGQQPPGVRGRRPSAAPPDRRGSIDLKPYLEFLDERLTLFWVRYVDLQANSAAVPILQDTAQLPFSLNLVLPADFLAFARTLLFVPLTKVR